MLVAGAAFELSQVALHLVPSRGAGRQPERQACADQRIGVEEVQLTAELAVVDHHSLLGVRATTAPAANTTPRADRPGCWLRLRGQRSSTPGVPGVGVLSWP